MTKETLKRWLVVVADDDEDSRLLMASSFRRAGFEVAEASNGVELLDSVAQGPKSHVMVVSDIGMPEMDGIAATEEVRRTSTRTPILLVTAFGDERTLKNARAAGADKVLLKPLDFPLLVQTAMELMSAPRPR